MKSCLYKGYSSVRDLWHKWDEWYELVNKKKKFSSSLCPRVGEFMRENYESDLCVCFDVNK